MPSSNGESSAPHAPLELGETCCRLQTKDGRLAAVRGRRHSRRSRRGGIVRRAAARTGATRRASEFIVTDLDGNLLEDESSRRRSSTTSHVCEEDEAAIAGRRADSRSVSLRERRRRPSLGRQCRRRALRRDRAGRANAGRRFLQVCRAGRLARRFRRLPADGQDDSADVSLHLRSRRTRDRSRAVSHLGASVHGRKPARRCI